MNCLDVQTRTFWKSNCIFLAQELNKNNHTKSAKHFYSLETFKFIISESQVSVTCWVLLAQFRLRKKSPCSIENCWRQKENLARIFYLHKILTKDNGNESESVNLWYVQKEFKFIITVRWKAVSRLFPVYITMRFLCPAHEEIARALILRNSYWVIMNEISIYAWAHRTAVCV